MTPSVQRVLLILTVAILPAFASGTMHPRRPNWDPNHLRPGEINSETVRKWTNVVWVDARPLRDFVRGHVPASLLLNEDNWDSLLEPFLQEWSPDKRVVVYCNGRACKASKSVAKRLREEIGIRDVFVLKGGWQAWNGGRV